MKRLISMFLSFVVIICVSSFNSSAAPAEFYYRIEDNKAVITATATSLKGDVVVPSVIDEYPVIGIDSYAIKDSANITHSIPFFMSNLISLVEPQTV